ncbi:MAG: tetratricopeptide repeat protein [Acidobacteria bacterium]|nr:tetratricopeptide repeat protein [Acidobacteriota bacterium]
MKRSERHHLKENAVAVAIGSLQRQLHERGRGLMTGIAIVLIALVLYGGYSWWSGRTVSRAGALLAEALVLAEAPVVPPPTAVAADLAELAPDDDADIAEPTDAAAPADTAAPAAVAAPVEFVQPLGTYPTIEAKLAAALPKLIEAADAYPGTQPGITARYRAAAALAALGRHEEAADQYRQVIDRDQGGIYGRMGTLGLADVQIARGAYDEAIVLLEQSSGVGAEADLPVDGVLMRLGHAYGLAGRSSEAQATFQRVMDEFPASLYVADAERELQALHTEG